MYELWNLGLIRYASFFLYYQRMEKETETQRKAMLLMTKLWLGADQSADSFFKLFKFKVVLKRIC